MTEQMNEQNVTNKKDNGLVEECAATNREVPGSTPGEAGQFTTEPPKLRYQGEETPTPLKKQGGKRPAVELSPILEGDFTESIKKTVDDAIKEAMKNAIPGMIESIRSELREFIKATVDQSIKELKDEMVQFVQAETDEVQAKNEALALCEAEQLETYNRRDNVKIFGVNEEDPSKYEQPELTMRKVLDVAGQIEADVNEVDISIAHRLPTRGATRPIIVRFARRIAKVNLMRKKRELRRNDHTKDIRVVEDVSKARSIFIGMLRSDERINNVWTKEGSVLYTKVNDDKVFKFSNLLSGAYDLGYSTDDILYCFRK